MGKKKVAVVEHIMNLVKNKAVLKTFEKKFDYKAKDLFLDLVQNTGSEVTNLNVTMFSAFFYWRLAPFIDTRESGSTHSIKTQEESLPCTNVTIVGGDKNLNGICFSPTFYPLGGGSKAAPTRHKSYVELKSTTIRDLRISGSVHLTGITKFENCTIASDCNLITHSYSSPVIVGGVVEGVPGGGVDVEPTVEVEINNLGIIEFINCDIEPCYFRYSDKMIFTNCRLIPAGKSGFANNDASVHPSSNNTGEKEFLKRTSYEYHSIFRNVNKVIFNGVYSPFSRVTLKLENTNMYLYNFENIDFSKGEEYEWTEPEYEPPTGPTDDDEDTEPQLEPPMFDIFTIEGYLNTESLTASKVIYDLPEVTLQNPLLLDSGEYHFVSGAIYDTLTDHDDVINKWFKNYNYDSTIENTRMVLLTKPIIGGVTKQELYCFRDNNTDSDSFVLYRTYVIDTYSKWQNHSGDTTIMSIDTTLNPSIYKTPCFIMTDKGLLDDDAKITIRDIIQEEYGILIPEGDTQIHLINKIVANSVILQEIKFLDYNISCIRMLGSYNEETYVDDDWVMLETKKIYDKSHISNHRVSHNDDPTVDLLDIDDIPYSCEIVLDGTQDTPIPVMSTWGLLNLVMNSCGLPILGSDEDRPLTRTLIFENKPISIKEGFECTRQQIYVLGEPLLKISRDKIKGTWTDWIGG